MKLMISTAAIVFAAISVPAVAAQATQQASAAAQKPVKVSSKAAKAIGALQTAVNKGDYSNLAALSAAAQAVASTPDDRYAIGELQLKAAVAQKNDAAMAAGVDAVAKSGFIDAAEASKLYASLGTTFYNEKQFEQATAAFQKSVAVDPHNAQGYTLLGEAKFAQGQKAEAASDFQHAVQIQTASGQKPDEALLKRAVSVAYEAQSPLAVDLAREWASAYPSADSWRNSIAIYRNLGHPDVEGTLDLLRLMQVTGAMNAGDYALFAEAAADQGNYNEAQEVLDAGIAAHVVDPSSAQFRDIISGLKGKPKATAADLESAAKMSPTSTNLLRIGDRYYGMGNYAKAADIYRQVLSKPDADKDVANLHLGMALARAGDKAGATAAFNAVGGGRAEIAKFWLAYVQQHA
jgi:tetratricopeptide (TPR) repeat protein